jgi:hypothetical protein
MDLRDCKYQQTGEKCISEELHNLHPSSSVVIGSRRMRNAYTILAENPDGKR